MTHSSPNTKPRVATADETAPGFDPFSGRLDTALQNVSKSARSAPDDRTPFGPPGQQRARDVEPVPDQPAPDKPRLTQPVGEGEHLVKQGECIASIAKDAGHFWETIWNDPDNRELREIRKNPNILLPADRVHVPALRPKSEPGQTLMRHRFVRKGEPSMIRVRVLRRDGQPRAQEPYELQIDAAKWEGVTDPDGWICVPMPGNARAGKLMVGVAGDQARYTLALGGVDPIDALTGIQQRLTNLGFAAGPCDGVFGPATRTALLRFQKHHGLSESGEPDEPTRAKLLEQHCS
jgi:hypothetical protein